MATPARASGEPVTQASAQPQLLSPGEFLREQREHQGCLVDRRSIGATECATHRRLDGSLSFAIDLLSERGEMKPGAPSVRVVNLAFKDSAICEPTKDAGERARMHAQGPGDIARRHLGRPTQHANHEALGTGHTKRFRHVLRTNVEGVRQVPHPLHEPQGLSPELGTLHASRRMRHDYFVYQRYGRIPRAAPAARDLPSGIGDPPRFRWSSNQSMIAMLGCYARCSRSTTRDAPGSGLRFRRVQQGRARGRVPVAGYADADLEDCMRTGAAFEREVCCQD